MFFTWLKRYLPKGLYGRSALILLVPIVTIQLVVSVMFIQRHFNGVTVQMVSNVVLEINFVLDRVNQVDETGTTVETFQKFAGPLGFAVELMPLAAKDQSDQKQFLDLTGNTVITQLHSMLPDTQYVDLKSNITAVSMRLSTENGDISLIFPRSRVSASNPHQLLVLMIFTSILMSVISIMFMRNQVRPIRRLARVADAFGKGQTLPYKVSGATEVRSAGQAFLDMRNRIERQIEQRTLMLSGVSHDLRTPLTRLKLGLSLAAEDEDTAAMLRDVDDMEMMLEEFLAFSRGDSLEEITAIDPQVLAAQIVEDSNRQTMTVALGKTKGKSKPITVNVRPVALRRAIENLISNGRRYGDRCCFQVQISANWVRFVIEDNGPGIPENLRDQALRPFIRLDEARNQDRVTGVGLGLSIALDIASSHGGSLDLSESAALGGLQATLSIPR